MSENGTDTQEFSFNEAELQEIERHIRKYPGDQLAKRSAVMPVLWIAQNKYGWLSEGALKLVAETLNLSYAHVYGVATFYTMYFKKPVPKFVCEVCTCFTCGELDGQKILDHAKSYTECDDKGYSKDGLFYFRSAECLGSCDTGPMMQVTNRHYVHNLTTEKIESTIEDLRAGKELSYVRIPLSDQSSI